MYGLASPYRQNATWLMSSLTAALLRAAVSANDDVIVRLANAEAPIRIEIGDDPPILLPPSPMIGEFIAGCASEGGAPTAEPDAATNATANSAE